MRLLHMLSLVAIVGLAACGTRARLTGITRLPPNANLQSNSAKGKALFATVAGKPCLPLDSIAREIQKDDTKYTVVTSDINVGQVQTGAGADGCVQFEPINNPEARAYVAFKSPHLRPTLEENLAGTAIQSSVAIGDALSVSTQDKCNSATLVKGDFAGPLTVLCRTGGRGLTLKGSTPAGSVIYDYYLGANSLTITKYLPVEVPANCTSPIYQGQIVRHTTVITWDASTRVQINRNFAQLFAKYLVTKNPELDKVLAENSAPNDKTPPIGTQVALTNNTYTYLKNMLGMDNQIDSQVTCPVP